jgi:putative metallohydrolase (TIGR04338 family)
MIVTKDNAIRVTGAEQRDQQRARLYRAEKVVLKGKTKPLPTVADIEAYIAKMQSRVTLVKRFGPALTRPIRVKDGRGTSIARGGVNHINMPLWSRNEFITLHEVAHVIAQRLHGTALAGHGWEYANIYLQLVQSMLGREKCEELKASFKAEKVRWTAKRKIIV